MLKLSSLKLLPLLCLSFSCSHSYMGTESMGQRMERYQAQNEKEYLRPEITVLPVDYSKPTGPSARNRAPASNQKPTPRKVGPFDSHSNRRIYFLTLLYQYSHFKKLLKENGPNIDFCPNFHSSMVDNGPKTSPHLDEMEQMSESEFLPPKYFSSLEKLIKDKKDLALYPELELPITMEHLHPTVFDILVSQESNESNGKTVLTSALKLHIQKIYQELVELCEYGQGQNYFIFENLITHRNGHKSTTGSTESMKLLLKTGLFINMSLLQAIKTHSANLDRTPASLDSYAQLKEEVFERLQANWTQEYFQELTKRRKHHFEEVSLSQ